MLRYELERLARRLAEELKTAERRLQRLRQDTINLHEAFSELDTLVSSATPESARLGFVYLIGHGHAVKIGWSDRHPAAPGGRLTEWQTGSPDELKLLGFIEGTFSLERRIHAMFAEHRLRGEWFAPAEQILAYFKENGTGV